MGYLERIFLGTMLLTALLILFLFGLYFDFGTMFTGSLIGPRMGFGQDQAQRRLRSRLTSTPEPRGSSLRPASTSRVGPSSPVNFDQNVRRPETVPMEVLIEREVRRLKRRGHSDQEYIRMQAVYEVDRTLVSIFDEYDRLIAAGDFAGAIALLLDARKHIPEDNPLALRDIFQYLQQAYVLAGRQKEAGDTMLELVSLQERIFSIEKRADRYKDNEGQAYLEKMQEGFGQLREALDKIETAPDEVAPYGALQADVMQGFTDPNAKVKLSEQHLRLFKAEIRKRVNSGLEDSLTEAQAQTIMSRLETR